MLNYEVELLKNNITKNYTQSLITLLKYCNTNRHHKNVDTIKIHIFLNILYLYNYYFYLHSSMEI